MLVAVLQGVVNGSGCRPDDNALTAADSNAQRRTEKEDGEDAVRQVTRRLMPQLRGCGGQVFVGSGAK